MTLTFSELLEDTKKKVGKINTYYEADRRYKVKALRNIREAIERLEGDTDETG